ncbi:thioredoxin [Fodinisporobacter ferrooxydans]|uniref:Thioredoxin n=1 Tax=Fodinisporobacter ferrooxydans TaxID=2901836 RepID=A0ABY4CEL4_9BACL|nr:thioredoxin [Alicyclobacillaceae bacterium MYW30-H2]
MAVKTITDQDFEQSVQGNTPVLVDFWAAWCGPCKMLSPIVDEVSDELSGQLVVGKLNVDENPQTAQKYGIMSIPTLLVFKNGQVVKQLVGYMSKNDLKAKLADVL